MADAVKDSGVVELFPQIGDSWRAQVSAQTGIDQFRRDDFLLLEQRFGVSWAVLRQTGDGRLDCPFKNGVVMVCRLP
jgi:hypothetical protein